MLRADQRRQFGEQQLRDGEQIALALQHAGELGDVGLEPVLIGVLAGGLGQVADHLVDVVFERRDFALRFHRDGSREIALGDGGGHVGDGADLSGEVGGELIDVVGEIAPDAGGAGHAGLAAQLAFDADFARHGGDLVGEGRQRVDHAVDGVGEFGDFALGFEHQFALRDRRWRRRSRPWRYRGPGW